MKENLAKKKLIMKILHLAIQNEFELISFRWNVLDTFDMFFQLSLVPKQILVP